MPSTTAVRKGHPRISGGGSEIRSAGEKATGRMFTREQLGVRTAWRTHRAQYDAVTACGSPDTSLLERVTTT
ncbi:hypothetical protein [Streptomyces sp. NPDC090021]|uniref:hypothetical protein n=1 Tax=Streptomyces sp. NPDC090021 TaxID=3365919 RepID=UPI0037FF601A